MTKSLCKLVPKELSCFGGQGGVAWPVAVPFRNWGNATGGPGGVGSTSADMRYGANALPCACGETEAWSISADGPWPRQTQAGWLPCPLIFS